MDTALDILFSREASGVKQAEGRDPVGASVGRGRLGYHRDALRHDQQLRDLEAAALRPSDLRSQCSLKSRIRRPMPNSSRRLQQPPKGR